MLPVVSGRRARVPAERRAWQNIVDLVMFTTHTHDRLHDVAETSGLAPALVRAMLSPSFASTRPVPLRSLAEQWRCDPSYVTSRVGELEQRGLVERRFDPEDHRFKTVALTDKGEQMRAEMRERLHEPPAFMSSLSSGEHRALGDLLDRLVHAAQDPACG
jgi:DNA-binding MarR family transcriptional regulator